MNDRQIDCFLEVARQLNFTRAAETLRLPQPAVSRYVSALEKELGTVLITRARNRKISLTEAGIAYYDLFQRTALELAHTKKLMDVSSEVLHVGINSGWSLAARLTKAAERCRKEIPNFQLSFECLDLSGLAAGLKKKKLDAVIGLENYLQQFQDFETRQFATVQRVVVYSKNLPGYKDIRKLADFSTYDFLFADDPLIRELVQQSEHIFRAFHFVPRFKALPNQETVYSYVESGSGVMLLDEWCRILNDPLFFNMNIDESVPVAIAWRRDSDASVVEVFTEALIKEFQETQL